MNSPFIRRMALLAVAAATAFLFGPGCTPSDSPDPSSSKPRIALIMKSLGNPFFVTMEAGARAHQQANADTYELLVNGMKNEIVVEQQIDLVERMIAQGVDAIVIAPADSKALVPVCQKAQQAGIVVVNIDNKFDDAVLASSRIRIPFVGPDNRHGARLVGEHLVKQLQPGDQVAIVEGAPNAFNGVQRKLGFEDALKAGGITIVSSQSGYWEMDKANQVVAALITEHPDLKAVLCANDDMALGALAALRGANKLESVKVVGYDNTPAAQQLLREGHLLATADQHADQLAVYGIQYALEMLKSNVQPADRQTPVELVTR